MRLLSTFFPKHPRPRMVVHAGPLLLKRSGGVRALRRYLRLPRRREVFLVHPGHESIRRVAQEAGVSDIALEASAKQDANAATELALALGARRLDFTIDEPCVSLADGIALREITLNEAESLARDPAMRPKIRAKLRAGCAALQQGISRVRIGDPAALMKDQATVLVPDPSLPFEVRQRPPREEPSERAAAAADPQPPLVLACREHPDRPSGTRGGDPRASALPLSASA